jgi:hypothetical protein
MSESVPGASDSVFGAVVDAGGSVLSAFLGAYLLLPRAEGPALCFILGESTFTEQHAELLGGLAPPVLQLTIKHSDLC